MKERPVLFSAPMVRAILEGRKTQTRRVIKRTFRLDQWHNNYPYLNPGAFDCKNTVLWYCSQSDIGRRQNCPYGLPGDRLWVRETWNICFRDQLAPDERFGKTADECIRDNHGFGCACAHGVVYAATSPDEHPTLGKAVWRPSIYMPRWASRITLEITDVRVQRVQAISDEDALAEGIHCVEIGSGYPNRYCALSASWQEIVESQTMAHDNPRGAFRDIWEAINGLRGFGWNANPWVWALTFKRVEQPA